MIRIPATQKAVMKGNGKFTVCLTRIAMSLTAAALTAFSASGIADASAKASHSKASVASTKSSAALHFTYSPYPPMINPIRIGLGTRVPLARFAVWAPGFVFVNGQAIFDVKPGQVYTIAGGRVTEMATGRSAILPTDQRSYVSASDYRIWTGNRWYRGCLELISFGNKVSVINLLDLEDYLLGVVPSEMPSSWCLEALKAQAVAARSYAWAHLGEHSKWRSEGFDLVPDVRDQAYKGLGVEAQSTFAAVSQTRGLVLKDSGRVKPGFYRAWVGDDMETNLNMRKSVVPASVLEKVTGVPKIVGVTVKKWDSGGNAHSIEVMGESRTVDVHIRYLREKLEEDPSHPKHILTVRGVGYRLVWE